MGYLLDNELKMTISMCLEMNLDDEVGEMLMAHERGDDDGVKEHYQKYLEANRLVDLGYEMLIDGKLEKWDWQWLADGGHLCDMDWVWFKDWLEKDGVSREEYNLKWK